jgi:hypothetical protein
VAQATEINEGDTREISGVESLNSGCGNLFGGPNGTKSRTFELAMSLQD